MTTNLTRRDALGLLAVTAAGVPSLSHADSTFPNRAIRIVVGFGPGIGIDITTRMLAEVIGKEQGITVLVENKPGSSTLLATNYVASAAKDGYTLLALNNQQYNNPLLYKNIAYKNSDFVPIAPGGLVSMVMAVSKEVAANNAREFVAYARANPDKIFYGYWGAGGSPQLMAAMLEKASGIKMQGVSYKDSGQATSDMAAGRIQLFFTSVTHGMPLHQAGRIKIIAVGTPKRLPALAEVPTFAEAGIDGVPAPWWGYGAPAGTPPDVLATLEKILRKGTASPRYLGLLANTGSSPLELNSAQAFNTFIDKQTEVWADVIKSLNIQLD